MTADVVYNNVIYSTYFQGLHKTFSAFIRVYCQQTGQKFQQTGRESLHDTSINLSHRYTHSLTPQQAVTATLHRNFSSGYIFLHITAQHMDGKAVLQYKETKDSIDGELRNMLHWLPKSQRIIFQIALIHPWPITCVLSWYLHTSRLRCLSLSVTALLTMMTRLCHVLGLHDMDRSFCVDVTSDL